MLKALTFQFSVYLVAKKVSETNFFRVSEQLTLNIRGFSKMAACVAIEISYTNKNVL
jgi:hypothetical protein